MPTIALTVTTPTGVFIENVIPVANLTSIPSGIDRAAQNWLNLRPKAVPSATFVLEVWDDKGRKVHQQTEHATDGQDLYLVRRLGALYASRNSSVVQTGPSPSKGGKARHRGV